MATKSPHSPSQWADMGRAAVFLVACLFFSEHATSQNRTLPACISEKNSEWDGCIGIYKFPNGATYVGEFSNGTFEGNGRISWGTGDIYIGEFSKGVLHGKAGHISADGVVYFGNYKNNRRQGQGFIAYPDGGSYLGEFSADEPNGFGRYIFSNGAVYSGQLKRGIFEGLGSFTSENSIQYSGEVKDNKRNGVGIVYSGGRIILESGVWMDDTLISKQQLDIIKYPFDADAAQLAEELRAGIRDALPESKSPKSIHNEIRFQVEGLAVGMRAIEKVATQDTKQKPASHDTAANDSLIKDSSPLTSIATEIHVRDDSKIAPGGGKRIALVIGNAKYKIKPLINPENDADDMSAALKASGFDVIDLRNARLAQMRQAVREFGDRLLKSDVGLVYYSGHGVEVKGKNYFIPVNSDIEREDEIPDQGLDIAVVLEKMNTAKKAINILILDACRDDPFGRSFRSVASGLATMDAPTGTIISYSTSPGRVAADGEGRNSPFTKHLLQAMRIPNKPIEQVFKEVRRAVQIETKYKQTPWENTSLNGDFFFRISR